MAGEATGTKKQRDQLRAAMRDQGCTPEQIAAEMGRQFGFRARQAWRHTHGWTQDEVAAAYNRQLGHDQAPMTGKRISDYEAWPHGGKKPTINALSTLATVYSTGVLNLIDLNDRKALSAQELITLDAHKKSPTPPVSGSPDAQPENSTQNPATPGEDTTLPEPNISIIIGQTNHMPEAMTPPQRHQRHLILGIILWSLAWLLTIITAIGGAITARTIATEPQTTMPAHTSTPSSPAAPSPLPTPPLPSLPSQTAPPQQPLIPSSPPPSATHAPHQLSIRTPPTPPPPSPSTRPHPLPPPPESPTAKTASVSAATITWKNMYSGLCLDEQEQDGTGDTGTLRLWPCNGSANQMWTEQIIPAHPTSIAKNLVSSRSGKCATYQPEPGDQISVWLAPCGKKGQGWIRHWNGKAYIFQAAEIPGACMSAPNGPAAKGLTGLQLRRCGPPSPLTDWRPHYSHQP